MSDNSMGIPYIPESQTELDAQLLRSDVRQVFKNKTLGKLLSDDLVRSYLNEYEMKALMHLASAYEGLTDASQGKYEGVFDNSAEMVLADISFIINIARSREGINIRTIKGRGPLEEFKPKWNIFDKFRPIPNSPKQQAEQQPYSMSYQNDYNYPK